MGATLTAEGRRRKNKGGTYPLYIYKKLYEKLCQQLHDQTAKCDVTMTIMCVFIKVQKSISLTCACNLLVS